MMKVNRLDGVLIRNRKHLVVDLALAVFFLMALLFSGFAFGTELPKLAPAQAKAPVETRQASDGVKLVMASASDSSPIEVH
jgi:hypothetical protein